MRRHRTRKALSRLCSTAPETPAIEQHADTETSRLLLGNNRRSGRLLGKAINLREEDSDTTSDKELIDSAYSGHSTPAKRRRISRTISRPRPKPKPASESDFVQDESNPDDDVLETEDASSSEDHTESPLREKCIRLAAQKAQRSIQASLRPAEAATGFETHKLGFAPSKKWEQLPFKSKRSCNITSKAAAQAALLYSTRQPQYVSPPVLSVDRLRVNSKSIHLYAKDGCCSIEEMWTSALSSTRFGGPRRSAPFRELHRLTDPLPVDDSDWAENIRWAKEQHRVFGSVTWTEYDYHLEQITEARRKTSWVSEAAIQAGM